MSADTKSIAKQLQGIYGQDVATGTAIPDMFLHELVNVSHAAGGSAGYTGYIGAFKAPFDLQVVEVAVAPGGALTAHDTNNATISLKKADGAGGAATTVASITTNVASGDWAVGVFKALSTPQNASVIAGQILTLEKAVASSGVNLPPASYSIKIRRA